MVCVWQDVRPALSTGGLRIHGRCDRERVAVSRQIQRIAHCSARTDRWISDADTSFDWSRQRSRVVQLHRRIGPGRARARLLEAVAQPDLHGFHLNGVDVRRVDG